LANLTRRAGLLAKVDLTTDMVREFTELQGTMGGIYAREEGLPEAVWKAIYFHYLPVGVEVNAPPSQAQLGPAAVVWAALSLADKLDSVVGMFAAGERPTGSRDPLGLRRQAQGVVKILADLPSLTGVDARPQLGDLLRRASAPFSHYQAAAPHVAAFMADRLAYLLEQRGFDARNVRAVMHAGIEHVSPLKARKKLEALAQMGGSEALLGVAALLKRVKNITKGVTQLPSWTEIGNVLTEPAERDLWTELDRRGAGIRAATDAGRYREAFAGIAALQPPVARFFDDVLVMADDLTIRSARLALVATLRDLILALADLSEIAPETHS
jgi:glycyl-tRNA synthetase beta chain